MTLLFSLFSRGLKGYVVALCFHCVPVNPPVGKGFEKGLILVTGSPPAFMKQDEDREIANDKHQKRMYQRRDFHALSYPRKVTDRRGQGHENVA